MFFYCPGLGHQEDVVGVYVFQGCEALGDFVQVPGFVDDEFQLVVVVVDEFLEDVFV